MLSCSLIFLRGTFSLHTSTAALFSSVLNGNLHCWCFRRQCGSRGPVLLLVWRVKRKVFVLHQRNSACSSLRHTKTQRKRPDGAVIDMGDTIITNAPLMFYNAYCTNWICAKLSWDTNKNGVQIEFARNWVGTQTKMEYKLKLREIELGHKQRWITNWIFSKLSWDTNKIEYKLNLREKQWSRPSWDKILRNIQ